MVPEITCVTAGGVLPYDAASDTPIVPRLPPVTSMLPEPPLMTTVVTRPVTV